LLKVESGTGSSPSLAAILRQGYGMALADCSFGE